MEEHSRKLPSRLAAFLLGVAGVLLYLVLISALVEPIPLAGAQDFHSLQVWPDHSIGVASGLLGDSTAHAAAQVFPLGACYTSEGDVVRARTYLHFPLDVFPPGTEILHATLYVYVDGGSSEGEATLGVYRAIEPWEDVAVGWGGAPDTWPALLDLPLAATTVRFGVVTPTQPVSIVVPTATPTPLPTPTLVPTATFTPTPFTSPLPTPTPFSTPTFPAPVVPLGQVAETWIAWDVTALMRAWFVGEAPNDGLVLASAPDPAAALEMTGDLLVARWFAATDSDTRPHIIAEFEVHPVTPTPTYLPSPLSTPTMPVPVLPSAGSTVGWKAVGLLFVGAVFLILGLASWRKSLLRLK